MKTTIITAAFIVLATLATSAENKNAETEFGTYTVVESQQSNAVITGGNHAYTIHYAQLDAPVTVQVVEENDCKVYLVRTEGYEVQYVCNGNTFGVQYMSEGYATLPVKEMQKKLNRTAYLHQRVVSQGIKSEKEFVRLIACYLPELIS